jgi:predicted nucleic acid-binding Zn ribbon protein
MENKRCVVCNNSLNGNRTKFCSIECNNSSKYINNKSKINTNSYARQQKIYKERKILLTKRLGGCCKNCGYDKNLSALEFNHIDTENKKFNIDGRHISNLKFDRLIEEVEKCELLCANCHREHHNPQLDKQSLNYDVTLKISGKPNCEICNAEISYGNNTCRKCASKKRRKVERPDYTSLLEDVNEFGYTKIGKKYGVSDNTIRKWLKK